MTQLEIRPFPFPEGLLTDWRAGRRAFLNRSDASPFIKRILIEKARNRPGPRFFGEAFVAANVKHSDGWYGSFKWLDSPRYLRPGRLDVQADLFDSELAAARSLVKSGFARAAGVLAGVVLEKHLAQVCSNHKIRITKKNPTIADLNDLLKKNDVTDVARWRYIQHLGDVRNLCGHSKNAEPTNDQVSDLVEGVGKTLKTLF